MKVDKTTDTNVRVTVLWYILIQSKDMKAGNAMIRMSEARAEL